MAANWTDEETLKFIEIYGTSATQAELASSTRKRDAYVMIAQEMETAGYNRSADQCIRKMKKLRFEYKKARGRNGRRGDNKNMWRYFEAMDSLLLFMGHKLATHPPADVESSKLHSAAEGHPPADIELRNMHFFPEGLPPAVAESSNVHAFTEDQSPAVAESNNMHTYAVGYPRTDVESRNMHISAEHQPPADGESSNMHTFAEHQPQAEVDSSNLRIFAEDVRELLVEKGEENLGEDKEEEIGRQLTSENGEPSRSHSETPSAANDSGEGTSWTRKRERDSRIDMMELLIDKMMMFQESSERQHYVLAEKQMALEEKSRRENQEFQLRLVSIISNSRASSSISQLSHCPSCHNHCCRYALNT